MVLKTDFVRGMENAQDPLNENFEQLGPLLEDTGWLDVELINGGTAWSDVFKPQFRLIRGIVYFRGVFGPSANVGNLDSAAPGRIPVEYAPKKELHFGTTQITSAAAERAIFYVTPTGYLRLDACSNTSKATSIDSIYYPLD